METLRINVKVIANAKKIQVFFLSPISLKVKLSAIAEGNKANTQLIEVLSKEFGVPKRLFRIVSGKLSNQKILEISFDTSALKEKVKNTIEERCRKEGS